MNIKYFEIAVLIFELENHEHRTLDDVDAINEYGRRINLPVLIASDGKKNVTHPICADKISISFGNINFTEDYVKTMNSIGTDTTFLEKHIAMNYIMRPIQELLDGRGEDNGGYEVTAHEEHQNNSTFYIKPCVDDRMFVCCLVRDDEYSNKIKEFDTARGEYRYLSDCYTFDAKGNAEKYGLDLDIYKLIFIETSVTSQSASMRHELLKRCVYDRWIDYGTIHGVTHHSIVCLTSADEGIIDSVINPFLTEYVQLAVLTVVQRAVILLLSDEASEVANGFAGDEVITKEEIASIEKLQARYVTAQNQLLLSEVTVQEQGVEIYEMLKNELYIKENMADLDSEIRNLRDAADIANARLERLNDEEDAIRDKKIENSLTLLSAILGGVSIAEPVSQLSECNWIPSECNWFLLSCVFGLLLWCITKYLMRNKG